jgi:hypothetical protein
VAQRHVTHTNASGVFVMSGVRSGSYRIVAHKEKQHGHVEMAVRTGSTSNAQIKI